MFDIGEIFDFRKAMSGVRHCIHTTILVNLDRMSDGGVLGSLSLGFIIDDSEKDVVVEVDKMLHIAVLQLRNYVLPSKSTGKYVASVKNRSYRTIVHKWHNCHHLQKKISRRQGPSL